MKKRLFALLLAALMLFSILAACTSEDDSDVSTGDTPTTGELGREPFVMPEVGTELPRDETLIFGGLQTQAPQGWHPFHDQQFNFAIDQQAYGSRHVIFESPFMYNVMMDEFVPLLAAEMFEWSDDMTYLTYTINPAAFWSDGTPVTAHDAAFTWYAGMYSSAGNSIWLSFIEDVVALDDMTVQVRAVMYGDAPVFALQVERYVGEVYILQQAWLEDLLERNNFEADAIGMDPGYDVVWSGPYTRFFSDETRNVLIRDDGYWGQHSSMWGRLPTPRFLVSLILADNAAITAALIAGDVDVTQHFISDVHLLWEDLGLPVSTFMDEPPFGMAANMPTAHFNMTVPVLQHVELRRAIAWATDFDLIIANAMTHQSPTFVEYPRSLFAPVPGEQALYDQSRVAHLQWDYQMPNVNDRIAAANELLDESGLFPMGDDGFRTYNGERVSLVASCPSGWSDWEASLEIVATAGAAIGIQITTNFVAEGEFYDHVTSGPPNPDSFDIFMMWTPSSSGIGAWDRTRWLLSFDADAWPHNWAGGNYSMWHNERANEIVNQIPLETDPQRIIDLYTEAVELYLYYVPSFSLMYRPNMFHTVGEFVWTGFTEQGDGRNVPPINALNGFAMADLFNIRLVE